MRKLILVLLTVMPFMGMAQPDDDVIPWKSSLKLKWADYLGKPEAAAQAAASTATYLGIEYKFTDNVLGYKITCSFSRTRSWVMHQTDHILAHEQGHFDIAEVFARKLNKEMKEYVFNKNTYRTDLKRIYDDVLLQKETMQNDYDRETNHSIDKEKQLVWQGRITELLMAYKAFALY